VPFVSSHSSASERFALMHVSLLIDLDMISPPRLSTLREQTTPYPAVRRIK
jgi:hypothetical protein